MPSITTNLTINNAAAAARTFVITMKSTLDSLFTERTRFASGSPVGWTRLRVRNSLPSSQRPSYKTNMDLDLPIIIVADGKETVARTLMARVEIVTPSDATQAERDDLVAFLINALNHASLKPVFQSNDPIY